MFRLDALKTEFSDAFSRYALISEVGYVLARPPHTAAHDARLLKWCFRGAVPINRLGAGSVQSLAKGRA